LSTLSNNFLTEETVKNFSPVSRETTTTHNSTYIIRFLQKSAYAGIKITTKISMISIKLNTTIIRSIK